MKSIGKVVGIKNQVVEVEFESEMPKIHDLLTLEEDNRAILEVIASSSLSKFFCLSLSNVNLLYRGAKIINTKKQISVPSGESALGRVIDIFLNSLDGLGPINRKDSHPIYDKKTNYIDEIKVPGKILETGIKAVDFFAPILKGGKVGLFGGAGVGKTIILTEFIHNILIMGSEDKNRVAVFSAVGERSREAQELHELINKSKVSALITLILGQMGESPAIRFRTAYSGVALAEHFRDNLKHDVLFLMDNMYRFAQAGHELSILMGSIPSEDGYQSTLTSEMSSLHERLISNNNGTITSIEAVFVPSDDMTDYGVRSIFPYLDTYVILSRDVYQEGRVPAIDLLESTSTGLSRDFVSPFHYLSYMEAKNILERARKLERIVSLIGSSELSLRDQEIYRRATTIRNYMTQNFFTTKEQTGKEGSHIDLKETVEDVMGIIEGKYDNVPPEKFLYIGSIKDAGI